MEQVRVFYACNNPGVLEKAINAWLASAGRIEVTQRSVVATGRLDHHVTVIYHYKALEQQSS